MIRVLGDVNSQAEQIAASFGSNITCTPRKIPLPFIDPNTGLNYYMDNQCTGASDGNQHSAALIVQDPLVYQTELQHPYNPASLFSPPLATATVISKDPAAPVPVQIYVPPMIGPTATITPEPLTPLMPLTPPPAGYNAYSDPSSPYYINVKTPSAQVPPAANPTGTTVTVSTTDPTAAGFTNDVQGFWQAPSVSTLTTAASAIPWYVWVAIGLAVYQFTKGKR
jgi:hypothetical protein